MPNQWQLRHAIAVCCALLQRTSGVGTVFFVWAQINMIIFVLLLYHMGDVHISFKLLHEIANILEETNNMRSLNLNMKICTYLSFSLLLIYHLSDLFTYVTLNLQ
jgi:hypothetical protein